MVGIFVDCRFNFVRSKAKIFTWVRAKFLLVANVVATRDVRKGGGGGGAIT